MVGVEERNVDWRMELGRHYEKLIILINYIDSVDIHFYRTNKTTSTLI
jgi:hypothetical protein